MRTVTTYIKYKIRKAEATTKLISFTKNIMINKYRHVTIKNIVSLKK